MRSSPSFGAASLLVAFAVLLAARSGAARVCLPPFNEQGQRLLSMTDLRVMWLEPLLRQHELCWRDKPDEVRIALFGDSAVFGFPLPVAQTFGAVINRRLDGEAIPAHVFNLAGLFTCAFRDTLILHETLRYDPDVIVYALTLADLTHLAPAPWPPLLRFFELNPEALARLVAAPPAGLDEPTERYRDVGDRPPWSVANDRMHQIGFVVHAVAHSLADTLARRFGAEPAPEPSPKPARKSGYDCEATLDQNTTFYHDFELWNPLEDLADIRARRGIQVLVVNWPDKAEPSGACFNRRYGKAVFDEYNRWLAAETARLNLPYLDLHDFLAPEEFVDSMHVTAAGHRRIGERVAQALEPLIQARLAERRRAPAQ